MMALSAFSVATAALLAGPRKGGVMAETGGLALGAISTRSRLAAWAAANASVMDTLPRLVPSLSIRCTRRALISSLMRGPSFWTGGAVLIGRRMAKNSSAVAPNAELAGPPGKAQ